MAVTKVINIKVNDGELDELNKDLLKVDKSFEKVEKSSKKTSSSIGSNLDSAEGAADNLSGGVAGIGRQFGVVAKAAKAGGKAMKSALISTGVGILLVALSEIVDNWDAISDAIFGANEELERQLQITKEVNSELERRNFINSLNIRSQKLQEKQDILKAKIAGASEGEITAIRRKGFLDRISIAEAEAEEANRVLTKSVGADEETYQKAIKAQQKAFAQLGDTRVQLSTFDLEQQLPDDAKAKKREKVKPIGGALTAEEQDLELQKIQQQFEQVFELKKLQSEQLKGLGEQGVNEALNNADVVAAKQKENDADWLIRKKILAEQEIQLTKMTLANISNVLGKTSVAGKAVAVATALINTYQGITAELATKTATPFEFGLKLANIASVAAIGFKSVKDIVSTKLPNLGGGSEASVGGGGGASAPSFNVVGTSGANQLAESLQADQEPVQAFVVGSNVTTQQALDRNILDTASIG